MNRWITCQQLKALPKIEENTKFYGMQETLRQQ